MDKKSLFTVLVSFILTLSGAGLVFIAQDAELEVLPIILPIKEHQKPLRTPDTFRENHSKEASQGQLVYIGDSAFKFKYTKSTTINKPFTGVFFPLENVNIDFSKFDEIHVKLTPNKARRIPFNLSVQNKKETHQYIRHFIEINKGQKEYVLKLDEFFTPSSWYERNNIAQVEIPKQDLSKIEALSFESCQLLKPGIQDEFTVEQLTLKKDLTVPMVLLFSLAALLLLGGWIVILKPFESKTEVVHVPIKQVEYEEKTSTEEQVIAFLGQNYTNPNLTLNDLSKEFGQSGTEISKLIKSQTKMTFPKYMSYLRIEEAKRVLQQNAFKTISEVGYAVGFNSPSNFIRVFKAQEGVSPKKFLEQQE